MTVQFARVVGVVLLVLGIVGLFVSTEILGLLSSAILEDIIHLAAGGLLAFLGFSRRPNGLLTMVVLVLGITLLVSGILGFFVPDLFGLLDPPWTTLDNVIHVALGAASIAVARMKAPRPVTA